jgi:hypothetical protein
MKCTKFLAYGFLVAVTLIQPVRAQSISTMGGPTDCGQWVTARSEKRSAILEESVVSFLNGFSMGHRVEFWSIGGAPISRDAVYLWVDNYCAANPLDNLIHATVRLYMQRSGWKG